MAKVKPNGMLSGVIGNTVLRDYNGTIVASEKPYHVRNPRSVSQQTNRLKMRNIINMYGVMKPALKDNFQGKSGRQSDYSHFQGCNLSRTAVYLTYKENNGCVVAPYVVSFGTLPSIEYQLVGEWLVTEIVVGDDLSMNSAVMDLSEYLVGSGDVFKVGDRVEFIACYQNVRNGFPTAGCEYCEFVLSRGDRTPLEHVLNGFELKVNEENKLCIRRVGACGLAVVRKRGEGREAFTSVQFLVVNNPVLGDYTSEEYKELAIGSYAKKK